MKTIKAILSTFVILITFQGFSITKDSAGIEMSRDIMVDMSARVHTGTVYFNLSMLNESKPGVYSLVKQFEDGSFVSVGIKEIGVNTINQPILYSFKDAPLETKPHSYLLVRISNDSEVVGKWYCSYCPDMPSGFCIDEAQLVENINE